MFCNKISCLYVFIFSSLITGIKIDDSQKINKKIDDFHLVKYLAFS